MDHQTNPRGPYRSQQRRTANQKPPLQLTDRDVAMLNAVFENRFLTRSLLLALFPPDASRAPRAATSGKFIGSNLDRRLAKLFHHGFLDRKRLVVGGELVYALGQRGADLLRTRQPELPLSEAADWAEKNRDLSGQYIAHGLMVARARTALTVAAAQAGHVALESFQRESRESKYEWLHHGARLYVNPDAFLILRDGLRPEGKQRFAFALEADQSTMANQSRMLPKFERYAALYADREHQHAFGVPTFRVLTVTRSAQRASNLLKLVAEATAPPLAALKSLFLFTSEEAYAAEPANVLAAIWRSAHQPHDLVSLVSSPLPRK